MKSEWVFAAFGAGDPLWRRAVRRIGRQAEESPVPMRIEVMTERSLDADFMRHHGEWCRSHPRGYGYWIWKPVLLNAILSDPTVAGVVYCDAGSTLNFRSVGARRRWVEYIERAEATGGVFFQMHLPELEWSKRDLTDSLQLSADDLGAGQVMGTHLMIRRDSPQHAMLSEWYEVMVQDDYHLVDDSPSRAAERPQFKAHRHDQAVLSGLLKRDRIEGVIPDETYFHPDWGRDGRDFPIWGTRFRSGASFHDRTAPTLVERGIGALILARRRVRGPR